MSVSSPVNEVSNQSSNGNQADGSQAESTLGADATTADSTAEQEKKAGALILQSQGAKVTSIRPHVGSLPHGRPVFPQSFEYYDSDTLPEHRPISLSTFKIVAMLPGDRPIAASHTDYLEDSNLPGHRPIAKSTLVYDIHNTLPGGRPIAQNQPDASGKLMGYLD